ncbi:uncharacterized protein LOC109414134 isoform X1 [Aedes albopictus]|uniref:Secreted protein n=1 Tax=Aedes albopictus TaxID=7160 RepID=A0ABM2A5Z1_AEDAL|nr:uncharacterized protein LOC109414134 [Aedes albopictus]
MSFSRDPGHLGISNTHVRNLARQVVNHGVSHYIPVQILHQHLSHESEVDSAGSSLFQLLSVWRRKNLVEYYPDANLGRIPSQLELVAGVWRPIMAGSMIGMLLEPYFAVNSLEVVPVSLLPWTRDLLMNLSNAAQYAVWLSMELALLEPHPMSRPTLAVGYSIHEGLAD